LLQKREETALNHDLNREKAKILDAAFVKKKIVAPRKLYAAIGMILLTLVVPVGYLFGKEQSKALIKEYRKAVKSRS
jgi:capsular polysaccharide biosynthesis protein